MATDDAVPSIVNSYKIILFLFDKRRHGAAFHQQFHFLDRRAQAAPDNFQDYRIDWHVFPPKGDERIDR